jgi:uncharacterized lipoprotein YajG
MRFLAILLACVGLSACAFTVDKIDVPYQPTTTLAALDSAKSATVSVQGIEARASYQDRVGVKKNGYGIELARIVATNDIPKTIGKAVERQLSSLGYVIGSGGCRVDVEVTRFYNDFKNGFFSAEAVAEAAVSVKVTGSDGKIAYAKHYEAGGIEPGIMLASGENARAALVKAMSNVVDNIMNDKDLQNAIMSSQSTSSAGKPMS